MGDGTRRRPVSPAEVGRSGPGVHPAEVALLVVALLGYALAVAIASVRGFNSWIVVDHLVGYETHGFIRRALVGSVVSPWVDGLDDIRVSFVVVSTIGAVALTLLLVAVGRRLQDEGQRWFLVVVAAGALTYVGWQPGRTDAIVLPLLVALWLWADHDGGPMLGAALVVVASLVHELGLLWGVGLVLGAMATGRLGRASAGVVVAVGAVAGVVLLLAGGFDGTSAEFLARLPFEPPLSDDLIIDRAAPWTGTPADAIASLRVWLGIASVIDLAVLPIVVVACTAVLWRRVGWPVAVLTVGPAVALAVVGIDHPRWASLLLLMTVLQLATVRALPGVDRRTALVLAAAVVVVGPLGEAQAFPRWID